MVWLNKSVLIIAVKMDFCFDDTSQVSGAGR